MTATSAPDQTKLELRAAIARVVRGEDLAEDEITEVFGAIMAGDATPAQIGGLLVALRMKGETPAEIAGAARAMRRVAAPFSCPDPDSAVDTCGTGGDGAGTVNVSTFAAIVAAGAGARVAKHGNRALSSRSGSADVLEHLGIAVGAPRAVAERCLSEVGIAFLFAPAFHEAMRHAAGPRRELGMRTLFNLLGPLTNPAGVKNQIVGVFDPRFCEPVARALGGLGARRAFVVHGEGGLDEIAVRGESLVAEWDHERGEVSRYAVSAADFGLREEDPAALAGGDAAQNAAALGRALAGEGGALRAAGIMEASVALVACGRARDFREGAERAAAAIDRGDAQNALERWASLSNTSAP